MVHIAQHTRVSYDLADNDACMGVDSLTVN